MFVPVFLYIGTDQRMLKLPILADVHQLLRQTEVILCVLKDLESSDFTQTMKVGDIITAFTFRPNFRANVLSLSFTLFFPQFQYQVLIPDI